MSRKSFEELGVAKWLCTALKNVAIYSPTAIQEACIPEILDGRDCIGGAKTGSGKTLAFAAPMLTDWSRDPYGICGLILTPTRELAIQIADQFSALGATMDIQIAVVVGGIDMVEQALQLQRRPHFVIATPGRLADHIKSSGEETVKGLRRVKYLVLDEADRLLAPGFADDLDTCMDILPDSAKRQTMLFTATVTNEVRSLKDAPPKPGKQPVFLHEVGIGEVAIPDTLSQYYLLVPSNKKEPYLYSLLTLEENTKKSAIIFVNRTNTAEMLRRMLQSMGVRSASLHGGMKQSERLNALGRFRAEVARILVATDVASRGLDIPVVEMVVNFDVPADADDYIHRIGRTARAGRKGDSISFVSELDVSRVHNIEERVGEKLVEYEGVTDQLVADTSLKKVSVAKREAMMDMEKEGYMDKKERYKRLAGPSTGIRKKKMKKVSKSKGSS
ncbi:ATP-dependent RNA helicase Dbp8p [Trichomonascus vanleenenianus]|uniref:ATP-dependent RNA helicase DBP8 n=1 Tax=Trichomonascus vanleenenianus TaxID=2268995 RepID=UPI003ECACFA0